MPRWFRSRVEAAAFWSLAVLLVAVVLTVTLAARGAPIETDAVATRPTGTPAGPSTGGPLTSPSSDAPTQPGPEPTMSTAPVTMPPSTPAPRPTAPPTAPPAVVGATTTLRPKLNPGSFLECVKAHESRGNYRAVNPASGAGGAYQFLPSTWANTARHAGRPDLVAVAPQNASPGDQDLMALHLLDWQGKSPWNGTGC